MKPALLALLFLNCVSGIFGASPIQKKPTEKEADSTLYYYRVLIELQNDADLKKAYRFYERALQASLQEGDSIEASNKLEVLAVAAYNGGDFNRSEQLLVEAFELMDNFTTPGTIKSKQRLLARLGAIYRNKHVYGKSMEYYKKSFEFASSNHDSLLLLNNLANVYRDQGLYDESIQTLQLAKKIAGRNDKKSRAFVLDNLGYTEYLGARDSSFYHINKSMELRRYINDTLALFSNYMHLFELYFKKNTVKAQGYAEDALATAHNIHDKTYELKALGMLAQLGLTSYFERYAQLDDSLDIVNQTRKNTYAAMKYDVDREKEQTTLARMDGERVKKERDFYIILTLFIGTLALAIGTYIYFDRRRKVLNAIAHNEARISKKLHDGLANDLFNVMAELQNEKSIDPEIVEKLDRMYATTRNISKDYSPLIAGGDFHDQLISRLNSYRSESLNVITVNADKIDWSKVNKHKKSAIYMVLGELMTNNRKHSKSSLAVIKFEENNKMLNITYSDNGVGGTIKKGYGLDNVESRILAVKGNLRFEANENKGFKVYIQV